MTAFYANRLRESDSRKHKENIIEQALTYALLGENNAIRFLGFLNWCYDPFATFGVIKVDTIPENTVTTPDSAWHNLDMLLLELHERKLTGNAARDAIAELSNQFSHSDWNDFVIGVIQKDLRAGISDKTINKVLKDTHWEITTFECQLAQPIDLERNDRYKSDYRVERKLDGVRMLMVVEGQVDSGIEPKITCYSRNGKVFENFKEIERQVAVNYRILASKLQTPNFVLDGEVMGNSFQQLMKQARRKKDADASDSIYNVFDYLPLEDFRRGYWNAQQHKRIQRLDNAKSVFDREKNLHLVSGITVDLDTSEGYDIMMRYNRDAVLEGYEGIMIKALNAPYVCKRSDYWLKMKPIHDYDLTITAVEVGTGRNASRLGALVCSGSDNGKQITVNVGSGFSDDDRDNYWRDRDILIGQTVVVAADAVTKNQDGTYSLRFPRFIRFRDDK